MVLEFSYLLFVQPLTHTHLFMYTHTHLFMYTHTYMHNSFSLFSVYYLSLSYFFQSPFPSTVLSLFNASSPCLFRHIYHSLPIALSLSLSSLSHLCCLSLCHLNILTLSHFLLRSLFSRIFYLSHSLSPFLYFTFFSICLFYTCLSLTSS